KKGTDDGDDFGAMAHARVNTAAVRVKTANDHVVEANERGEDAHQGDEPQRCVAGHGKGETDDVGLARAPVAVQNRGRAFPIDIARSLNVCWYQLIRLKRDDTRATGRLTSGVDFPATSFCPLMMLTRLAVGLEPLNAPDAAHRSPRSAPHSRSEFGSPIGVATRRSIKRNKELAKSSDWQTRQSSEPLAACAFRTLHWR